MSPMLTRLVGLLTAGVLLFAASPALAGLYTVTDLGSLGGGYTTATGVNAAGQVAGYSRTAGNKDHAFLYQNGLMTDLGTLGGASSLAYGVNAAGQVVGESNSRAFLWQNGAMTDLGTLGGGGSRANGINDLGQVVGFSWTGAGAGHAFLWQNGVMTDLGTLGGTYRNSSEAYASNTVGQVVGASDTHAFLWQNGVMTDLGTFGGSRAAAVGINNAGQVIGFSETVGGANRAFLWQNGVATDLGTLGGRSSLAWGINATGQVVGTSQTADGTYHAFLWENGVMADLNTLLPPEFGHVLTGARGISEDGRIAANGSAYLLTPAAAVPEPSSLAMLGIGAAGLVGYARGRAGRRTATA